MALLDASLCLLLENSLVPDTGNRIPNKVRLSAYFHEL